MMIPSQPTIQDLAALNAQFETADPSEVLTWAFDQLGDVVVACSFEDLVLVDLVRARWPEAEFVFLDTGGHFPETLEFVDRIEREWSLRITRPALGPDVADWPCGTAQCCALRKVEPLQRTLAGRAGWITSLKRVDAPTRATTPIVSYVEKFGLVKVNPLATWTDDDIAYYIQQYALASHPLWAEGYASIGCAAVTTKPVNPGDRRSGRWAGGDKVECGLHEE